METYKNIIEIAFKNAENNISKIKDNIIKMYSIIRKKKKKKKKKKII